MRYFIKQLIGALFTPVIWALLIAGVALILRWRGRRDAARPLLLCAVLVGYLGSISIVGDALLKPLETQFPPLQESLVPPVTYVAVLGSGYTPHDGIPITAALTADGLARIVEGVRLMRLPGVRRLIVSGGAPPGQSPSALGYAGLARELGVPEASLVVSDRSLDTAAEARAIAKLVGRAPFILVTSAYHMPRAMFLMRRAGASPIPAPTGQRVRGPSHRQWYGLLPGPDGIECTERALHEYAGLAAIAAGLD